MKHLSYAVLLAAVFALPAAAAQDDAKKTSEASKVSSAEVTFMKTAAADGVAEVKHGQLASEKGASEEVKETGKMMVTDHTKANEELKALATSKGVQLPEDLDAKHKKMQEELAKLSGAEFDKKYVAEMVKAHIASVALFEKASKTAKDPDVKAFAEKTLPTLQHHLEHVQKLSGSKSGQAAKSDTGR